MELKLKIIARRDTYSIGKLYIDGIYFCDTLEDTVRDINHNGKFDNGEVKVYGKTAIPFGKYSVVYTYSPKFKRKLPLLLNVPQFEGIRIHPGNTAEDSLGCILVGKNTAVGKLTESKVTSDKLNNLIQTAINNGESIMLIKE